MQTRKLHVVLLGLWIGVFSYEPVLAQSFDKLKMNTFLEKLSENDRMMASVQIDSAGEKAYQFVSGYIDEDLKTKADSETKYRIGSVTKTFTATMIMQLVEEDKLTFSRKLSEFYPDMPRAGDITIEHLLRHQSGLYNFTNAPDYPDWMTEPQSKEQLLQIFYNDETQFEPGETVSYSNTNYVLLQFIIEDVTGDSYSGQLQKRIVDPLALEHTHYGDGIETSKNEALSYEFREHKWRPATETDMSVPGGAGAVVSTPEELTVFIRGLFGGQLISKESLDKMTEIELQFGMGLIRIPFYDRYGYGHTGGIDGFQSNVAYFPADDVTVAFTSNGLNYNMNDIIIGILSIYFNKDFEIPNLDQKTISLRAAQKEQFVGDYSSNQIPMDIRVFLQNGSLQAQGTSQPAFPLVASDSATLRFDKAGVVMEFDSLENGKYQKFILKQSGGEFQFNRKKESGK